MNFMRSSAARSAGLLLAAALVSACAGSAPRTAQEPSFAPALTVERFLRAANQGDLDTMSSLFGTRDGSVTGQWSRKEVDERMLIFATVLRHQDYSITGEQIVPGRREEATQLNVRLVTQNGNVAEVPFTLVRTRRDSSWLVENFDLAALTRAR
jgi:hypothetical protein